ncbi:hypothetical protein ANN_05082 [Periplaneta americana]|uniref:Nose resistant-to-fluoxetine protein N-terminal domain-containing protein n=1 Tax=Periplaneta americana TaxID=6978 RepID=A0ABQ8TA56_PERAM|nr:hypothetical protein ANN_05082 [Periplaneta americana]
MVALTSCSPRNLQPLPTDGISQICQNHSFMMGKEALKRSKWALQMLDSTSKLQSGLLQGSIIELGNFDECLEVDVHEEWGSFVGQHCSTIFKFSSPDVDEIVGNVNRRNKILLLFSWKTNGKALFNTQDVNFSLDAVHGMRFLSMCAVVLGHTFTITIGTPSVNLLPFMERVRDWNHLYFNNLTFAVDTFFVMSGMLLCYITMQVLDAGKKFNVPVFYIHRFLR